MLKNKITYIGLYDENGNEVESTVRSICPVEEFTIDKCGRISNKTEIYTGMPDKFFLSTGYFIKRSNQVISAHWENRPIQILKDREVVFKIKSIMILGAEADIFKEWMNG